MFLVFALFLCQKRIATLILSIIYRGIKDILKNDDETDIAQYHVTRKSIMRGFLMLNIIEHVISVGNISRKMPQTNVNKIANEIERTNL